ncbi:Carboxypeptidase N subunit 2 [Pseudolycoriella hygida]|uniref:Carboxypeptidase N subunit 2 n=1 Tax=Pseudolycoriella hygida TaxID=35572 RepID=A0A9Q0S1W4_9DIPT|nr:Carboxypeptidase N subunit 2 [Pseudolycoriella hygida]
MKFFLLISVLLPLAVAQGPPGLTCTYFFAFDTYRCELSINNPNGWNNFTEIGGIHLEGFSHADVTYVYRVAGFSPIIPSIVCNTFPNIARMMFYNTFLSTIDDTSFDGCSRITELDLVLNQISSITPNAFANLPDLRLVYLESNFFTTLPENLFANQQAVTMLDLNFNPLSDIPAGLFQPLENLQTLLLGYNNLNAINNQWFTSNTRLEYLDLGGNRIVLQADSFVGLGSLKYLNLARNVLNDIPNGTFQPLTQLQYLYLYGNNFTVLEPDFFPDLDNLMYLDLSENPTTTILDGAFRGLTNLNSLILSSCDIRELSPNSFEGLANVHTIQLNFNDIEELPLGVFVPLENLDYIGLWNNRVKTIRRNSFGNLEHLETVDLDGNIMNALDRAFVDDAVNLRTLYFFGNLCASNYFGNFDINREQYLAMLQNCFDNMRFIVDITTEADGQYSFFEGRQPGIVVRVNTDSEAQIALTPFNFEWTPMVEVFIGTANNTRSVIRVNQNTNVVTVPTPNIIRPNQWSDFRITWANQLILVFSGNDRFPFMGFTMTDFFPVNFYAHTTYTNFQHTEILNNCRSSSSSLQWLLTGIATILAGETKGPVNVLYVLKCKGTPNVRKIVTKLHDIVDHNFRAENHLVLEKVHRSLDVEIQQRCERLLDTFHDNDQPQWEMHVLYREDSKEYAVVWSVHHSYGDATIFTQVIRYALADEPFPIKINPLEWNRKRRSFCSKIFNHIEALFLCTIGSGWFAGIYGQCLGQAHNALTEERGKSHCRTVTFDLTELKTIHRKLCKDSPIRLVSLLFSYVSPAFQRALSSSKSEKPSTILASTVEANYPYNSLELCVNVCSLWFDLPLNIKPLQERLRVIDTRIRNVTDHIGMSLFKIGINLVGALISPIARWLESSGSLTQSTYISNIVGPQDYFTIFEGDLVTCMYVYSPISLEEVVTTVAYTYGDEITLAILTPDRVIKKLPTFLDDFIAGIKDEMGKYRELSKTVKETGILKVFDCTTGAELQMVRGERVPLGTAPFMASLRSLQNIHFCGGVIVSTRFILSSRTCTNGRLATAINILVGTYLRNSGGITYRGSSKIDHPGYNPTTLANDITLIQTTAVIALTANIQVAVLNSYLSVERLSVSVFGWGYVSEPEFDPNYISRISTDTITNDECRAYDFPYANHLENKICTSLSNRAICYGDEGGALMSGNELIGIASWHSHCDVNVPNVYERIAPNRLWILSRI